MDGSDDGAGGGDPGGRPDAQSESAGAPSPTPSDGDVAQLRRQIETLTARLGKANDESAKRRIAAREASEEQGRWQEVANAYKSERDELTARIAELESLQPDASAYRSLRDSAAARVQERREAGGLPDYLTPLLDGADPLAALDAIRAFDASSTDAAPRPPTKAPESGAPAEDAPFDYATASREDREAWYRRTMANSRPRNSWAG